MMLDRFQHFVLIADHGTFTAAARHAHLSQPALTASIHRLEEDLGAPLFARTRTGASLTAAGAALLPSARAALSAVNAGRRSVAEVSGLTAGEVRIGAGATVCTFLLPTAIAAFRRLHPSIRFTVRETTTSEALDAIARDALDLAVVSGLAGEALFADELVLVAAKGAPTTDAPFVTFREGGSTRDILTQRFPEAQVAMELGGIAAVKAHVLAGVGVALLSRLAVADELASGALVLVSDPRTPIARSMRLVDRGAGRLSPAARAFGAHLQQRQSGADHHLVER